MNDTKNVLNSGDVDGIDAALDALAGRWRGVDLRQLTYFAVLARERHFGRAAKRLRISQPPLSMQVKALESRLGVAVLERGRHGATLTPAGAALFELACRILPQYAQGLAHVVAAGRGERGRLRIGFVTPAGASFLPGFVRGLHERWPDINLELHEATSDEQFPALLDARLDAGFVLAPAPEALAFRPVYDEPLVLAMPAGLAAAVPSAPVAAAALPDVPLLVFPREKAPALYDEILGYWASAGRPPRIGQQAIQMPTIVSLVAAGLGVALVPASMRRAARAEVVYRDLADPAPRIRIGVSWRAPASDAVLIRLLGELGVAPGG